MLFVVVVAIIDWTGAQMGKSGKDLLIRFLSVPTGFKLLTDKQNFINPELDYWMKSGNTEYALNIEQALEAGIMKRVKGLENAKCVFLPCCCCEHLSEEATDCLVTR